MQKDFYRRFLHEADAASKLDHPNILPIYAYGEEEGLPYIVMPLMEGGTLLDYMSERGSLSLHEAQWYLEQLTAALDYAHEHGCVHCDVKPANMLLDSGGRVMLSDFGIAHLASGSGRSGSAVARTSQAVMGTPDYISPEQALGRDVDRCSDIYSLGVTLFFLLAKRLPFKADTPIAVALMHIEEPPPSLSLLRADVSPALDRVVQKALAKDPARRFQTAGDFYDAFVSALASEYQESPLESLQEVRMFDDDISDDFLTSLSAHPVAQPFVRLLPLRKQHPVRRLVRLGVICFLVLSIIGTTLALVISHISQPVPSPPLPKDKLEDIHKWSLGGAFSFDSHSQSYHMLNTFPHVMLALYSRGEYDDFRLTVRASEIQNTPGNSDYYGVIFRASLNQSHYYLFEIAPKDGRYSFLRYDGMEPEYFLQDVLLPPGVLNSNASNTIAVEARGEYFTFFVNGTPVFSPVSDTSKKTPLQKGYIGLCVEDQGTEVAFSQLFINEQS
jgi:serine/threonine protein kinase